MINNLIKRFLKKNQVLRNNHLHKSCYIIGNGSSLKYIDLGMLCDLPSLITGLNYLHTDFKKLNVVADFHLHSGIFSPIWRNPYTKKIVFKNQMRKFLIKTNRIKKNLNFFTSIYNAPFLINSKSKNIFYLHHFNSKFNVEKNDISEEFALMDGSLFAMIAVAAYMGFREIIFVGNDYLSINPKAGHFYEYGFSDSKINISRYISQVKLCTNYFEKKFNCSFNFLSYGKFESSLFKNINYENRFNKKICYKENDEIVSKIFLSDLKNVEFNYRIEAIK